MLQALSNDMKHIFYDVRFFYDRGPHVEDKNRKYEAVNSVLDTKYAGLSEKVRKNIYDQFVKIYERKNLNTIQRSFSKRRYKEIGTQGEEMKEECIVCKAPLVYLEKDEWMECVLCHKKEMSKTRCQVGHYVCNDCHTKGMDAIVSTCLDEQSKIRLKSSEHDECTILSYAWTGTSCYGWSIATYRL